jgi:hypothetical protein
MLEEVFSLYTQILDCQKTAATYLKEGNHQLKNLPIHKNTVWQLDRFWDCEILKDYRYQTMQYVGVFLSKYAFRLLEDYQEQRRQGIKDPIFTKDKMKDIEQDIECW